MRLRVYVKIKDNEDFRCQESYCEIIKRCSSEVSVCINR
jgi:hypothetical protein